jgi:hypothetical protein
VGLLGRSAGRELVEWLANKRPMGLGRPVTFV